MTALGGLLLARVAQTGPMRLSDYMAECLLHPTHGYYATRDPFGVAGDFTTAPEISQMFGELLGLCLAQAWLDQGSPAPFTLGELGPGRGTLMADVLRATKSVPGFHAGATVVLVEASAHLRGVQRATLGDVTWVDTVQDLPDQPLFLLANEFFDALPIRQFTHVGDGWAETVVGAVDGRLVLGRNPTITMDHQGESGDVVEFCPMAAPVMAHIGGLIATHGGAALIVDYGGWGTAGDTFQAVQAHAFVDPLAAPGMADLTSHVDFAALAAASPTAHAYTTQGALLASLGIQARSARLATRLTGAARDAHVQATRRLTHPDEMGQLFKALALYPHGATPPPGMP
jgi:NADH dehydrogenase [ubiquinone] 1 alpha subcomplex assembly factor 7